MAGWHLELWMGGAIVLLGLGAITYRAWSPTPAADLAEIERFLRDRGEQLVKLDQEPLWANSPMPFRDIMTTRVYLVLASDAAGAKYVHHLATSRFLAPPRPTLMQRRDGIWTEVQQ